MPQRNDRSRSTPTTSPKNNSWFRMQAGHQSDADIYIYDEIGFWGVTAKQFISDLNALGDITHINLHINSPGGDVFEDMVRPLPFMSTVWRRQWRRSLRWWETRSLCRKTPS